MQQRIDAHHQKDEKGRPAGGHTLIVIDEKLDEAKHALIIPWQQGPLRVPVGKDIGGAQLYDELQPNGVFVESLIAAAADRIRFYQSSPFNCRENALALTKLEEALHWLHSRTARRVAGGIEGTHGVDQTERGTEECPTPPAASAHSGGY